MIHAAQRSNTSIYAFDPSDIVIGDRTAQIRKDNLRTIAEATSGFAVVNTNAVEAGVHRVMAESGTYYLLGYLSSTRADGKHHSIRVRIARAELEVAAREGYVAARAGRRQAPSEGGNAIATLLAAPVQKSGLPMRFAAVRIPAGSRSATTPVAIVVNVPGAALQSARGFQLSAVAVDSVSAKVVAHDGLEIAPGASQGTARGYVRIALRLDVKPGTYQLRLAGRTTDGSGEGSIFAELVVPRGSSHADIGDLYLGTQGARVLRSERIATLLRIMPVATEGVGGGEMWAALPANFANVPRRLVRCTAQIVDTAGSTIELPGDRVSIVDDGPAQIAIGVPELPTGTYRLIAHVYAGTLDLGTRELAFRRQ